MHDLPILLRQGSGLPFYRQVKDALRDRIRSGQLPPGSPLPSIRELAAQLLVSVITIKKAYDDLLSEGFIVSHQGKGTFVADKQDVSSKVLADEISEEIREIFLRAKSLGVSKAALATCVESALREYEESK
jgi:GntR family transcriptional regulator